MLLRGIQTYQRSFQGLSAEVWWLALITFINRAGTMVMPFLSLYLTSDLGYTLKHVGWIMTAFGAGSVVGAWVGGKLTGRFGYYPVMFFSLFISGLMFVGMQYIQSFWGLCVGMFLLIMVADMFRPASWIAIANYSKPENRTRSVTLIRLAINLGFSMGPALGGLIISQLSYPGLFWVDGITCMAASLLFLYLLKEKESSREAKTDEAGNKLQSPYRDKPFIIFLVAMLLIAFAFLQYFSTIPLYYKEVHLLSEEKIGWLMSMNGLLIFLIEMPLVSHVENKKFSKMRILAGSTILFMLSFIVLNLSGWVGVLVLGMLFMTIGEMLNFPFLNAFAMDRAEKGKQGDYMALFTMTFSIAHIVAHNAGMQLINLAGYDLTWYIMAGCLLGSIGLFIWLRQILKREED